jgi:hypothetical protein
LGTVLECCGISVNIEGLRDINEWPDSTRSHGTKLKTKNTQYITENQLINHMKLKINFILNYLIEYNLNNS